MWKFAWEKDIGERKVLNPVKECIFYQYHQRFTVPTTFSQDMHEMLSSYEYDLQQSKRNIQHHISLKTYENWCPYDNHSYSSRERIAKLNKEALGKIKNTSENDRRGCPSL